MNYNVVFHVDMDDEKVMNLTIMNLFNFYEDPSSKGAETVLLVNGPGVLLITKDKISPELVKFQKQGLSIRVCQNAITKFAIAKENLPDGITIVTGGVVELVALQSKGFAYIKP